MTLRKKEGDETDALLHGACTAWKESRAHGGIAAAGGRKSKRRQAREGKRANHASYEGGRAAGVSTTILRRAHDRGTSSPC